MPREKRKYNIQIGGTRKSRKEVREDVTKNSPCKLILEKQKKDNLLYFKCACYNNGKSCLNLRVKCERIQQEKWRSSYSIGKEEDTSGKQLEDIPELVKAYTNSMRKKSQKVFLEAFVKIHFREGWSSRHQTRFNSSFDDLTESTKELLPDDRIDLLEQFLEKFDVLSTRKGEVNLKNKKLKDADVAELIEVLEQKQSVFALSLALNSIASERMKDLAKTTAYLTRLNLGFCNIGNNGMENFISAITGNDIVTSLEYFNLQNNGIDTNGSESIGSLLSDTKRFSDLKELVLTGNEFCPKGIENISNGLRRNTTLKTLVYVNKMSLFHQIILSQITQRMKCGGLLSGGMHDSELEKLIKGLKENSALEKLVLDGNSFTKRGQKAIEACRDNHPSLKIVSLKNADVDRSVQEDIEEILCSTSRDEKAVCLDILPE
eukprot:CAMPEP_0184007852 /NCGR_PEP_ID=MMETSP0954-20121128/1601_1 /TAXON_ID=627963 /ORGANISM="Aplanochytrium sp, Strain PBS07" /LENGTH=432 /DNA_ID=CAMNT_0026286803 /DNA_START=218 /DNA_END=1516 /DNA_ORIENTATION=+